MPYYFSRVAVGAIIAILIAAALVACSQQPEPQPTAVPTCCAASCASRRADGRCSGAGGCASDACDCGSRADSGSGRDGDCRAGTGGDRSACA